MFILPLGGAVHSIPSAAQLYRVSDLMGHQTLSAHGDCHWRLPVWQLLIGSGALVVVQNFLASHHYDDSWWCHWTHICKTNSTFNVCPTSSIYFICILFSEKIFWLTFIVIFFVFFSVTYIFLFIYHVSPLVDTSAGGCYNYEEGCRWDVGSQRWLR